MLCIKERYTDKKKELKMLYNQDYNRFGEGEEGEGRGEGCCMMLKGGH